jgi:hypothetical protein
MKIKAGVTDSDCEADSHSVSSLLVESRAAEGRDEDPGRSKSMLTVWKVVYNH